MSGNKKSSIKDYLIEFVIVILGITIAFWLSNLGEIKKENRLENSYLQQLRDDLITDINVLDRGIKSSGKKIEFLEQGLGFILSNQRNTISADSVAKYALTLGDFGYFFTPTNDTYLTLQQSGDLKIIKSLVLKKKLVTLYKYYDLIKLEQKNFLAALDDNFFPKMYENYDMITDKVTGPSFFRSTLSINFIAFAAQGTQTLNSLFENSQKLAFETRDFIKTELGESDSAQNESD